MSDLIDMDVKEGEREKSVRFRRKADDVGFAQVHHVITMDANLSDRAFRLYAILLKYAHQKEECWPGIGRLREDLGWGSQKTSRAMTELVDRGLITRQRRVGTSSMTWIEDVDEAYEEVLDAITRRSCERSHGGHVKGHTERRRS